MQNQEFLTFFEACSKPGSATKYLYDEINKIYDESKKKAVGELKFFSGILISTAIFSLLAKSFADTEARAIFVLYLISLSALILRSWIVLRISAPSYDSIFTSSGTIENPAPKKADEEWAQTMLVHFKEARSNSSLELIFKGFILFILFISIVSTAYLIYKTL